MSDITIMTHRCEQLLEHNKTHSKISIRKTVNPTMMFEKLLEYDKWSLFELDYDLDYDSNHLHKICEVVYCPFCSAKLERE